MTTEAEAGDPAAGFLANLIARRFFDLLRERGEQLMTVAGGVRFLTFKPWHETPEADRDALSDVFAHLMREAREQRADWTRAFIEAEAARLREEIELRDPAALRVIGARPPDGYAVNLPFEPLTETLRDCTGEPVGFRERVSPDVMNGAEFDRLKALDQQVRAARFELFRLSEEIRAEVASIRGANPLQRSEVEADVLEYFVSMFETTLVRHGLAPAPEDFPDPKTLEVEVHFSAEVDPLSLGAMKEHEAQTELYLRRARAAAEKKAGAQLLRLRDRIKSVLDELPDEARRGDAAERFANAFNLIAVEIESIVYECGLAPKLKDEGSAEG